jgi:hypothetical protein
VAGIPEHGGARCHPAVEHPHSRRSRQTCAHQYPRVRAERTDEAAGVGRPHLCWPPFPGTFFETPASLACIYGLVAVTPGCDPNTVTTVSNRGSKVIAIVDAFDNPSALADLTLYSAQFGLPAPTAANFQVVYATGVQPANDTGWALEEALFLGHRPRRKSSPSVGRAHLAGPLPALSVLSPAGRTRAEG